MNLFTRLTLGVVISMAAMLPVCGGQVKDAAYTDGDFRRIISAGGNETSGILSAPVSKHMTTSPRSIRSGSYAAEIVRVFEKMQIDDLPVVDDAGCAVGLVDIQDLPKMKVI